MRTKYFAYFIAILFVTFNSFILIINKLFKIYNFLRLISLKQWLSRNYVKYYQSNMCLFISNYRNDYVQSKDRVFYQSNF